MNATPDTQAAGGETRPPGRVTGFFHASVTVRDMETALRFYRDALGFDLISLGPTGGPEASQIWNFDVAPGQAKVAFLRVPDSDVMVELFEFSGIEQHSASARPCDYGGGHFCVYVDDAAAVHKRAVTHGFSSRSGGPVTISRGPHAGAKAVYLIDPDGYHVELYQRPGRV